MNTYDKSGEQAIDYLGKTVILVVVCMTLCFLTTIGYNTYISITQNKIEVQTQQMNSNLSK